MNILFLALEPPYPPTDGGRLRAFNILRQVAREHPVTLLAFESHKTSDTDWTELRDICQDVHVVPLPVVPRATPEERVEAIVTRRPLALRLFRSDRMVAALRDLLATRPFDVVHLNHIYLAQYGHLLAGKPTVLEHYDVEVQRQRRLLRNAPDRYRPLWWARWVEYLLWLSYERETAGWFDLNCVVSESDASYFRRYSKGPVVVVPNGVDVSAFRPCAATRTPYSLAYVGSMDYKPNEDAVLWFCQSILPVIRQHIPAARFTIVGREPTDAVRELARSPLVDVTGTVDSVLPYYWRSEVIVVPLRAASGTRLKILEALAAGCPVVSTTVGAEGLSLADGTHLLLRDTPEQFAAGAVALLESDDLRQRLALAGRQVVKERYDWARIGNLMEQCCLRALGKSSPSLFASFKDC